MEHGTPSPSLIVGQDNSKAGAEPNCTPQPTSHDAQKGKPMQDIFPVGGGPGLCRHRVLQRAPLPHLREFAENETNAASQKLAWQLSNGAS